MGPIGAARVGFKDGKYMKDVDEIIGNVEIGTYN